MMERGDVEIRISFREYWMGITILWKGFKIRTPRYHFHLLTWLDHLIQFIFLLGLFDYFYNIEKFQLVYRLFLYFQLILWNFFDKQKNCRDLHLIGLEFKRLGIKLKLLIPHQLEQFSGTINLVKLKSTNFSCKN